MVRLAVNHLVYTQISTVYLPDFLGNIYSGVATSWSYTNFGRLQKSCNVIMSIEVLNYLPERDTFINKGSQPLTLVDPRQSTVPGMPYSLL